MENLNESSIPQCYVVVRKLSLEEISRMVISPYFITHKCGRCKKVVCYGPQCSTCQTYYHYNCAVLNTNCCGLKILFAESFAGSRCPRCKEIVQFGPQCSICFTMFHSSCVSPYDHCCQLNLCDRKKSLNDCGKCLNPVEFGPKCPLCKTIYHVSCVGGDNLQCCGIRFTHDENVNYRCRKCKRKLSLSSPMCLYCGKLSHGCCINRNKTCCGKRLPLEIYLIPSFKFLLSYYTQFDRRRATLRQSGEVINHKHNLRSTNKLTTETPQSRTKKKKSASCQTSVLDSIEIADVKIELEQKEIEIFDSPPVLEREESPSPEPSSSHVTPEKVAESDESLKNLFDFLYKSVKKFPPHIQTQVKVDLFKVVTEAEMKWQCNMGQSH